MKAGDLVKCHDTSERGIIIDIDPLRNHPKSKQGQPGYKLVEIVVMLSCGTVWYARPQDWEVISGEV